MELRTINVELTGQSDNGELHVAGYVNKTGQWSQPLGREQRFIEKIEPGTFQRALDKGNDIHFLAEHDNKMLLASTKNGSLQLREDEQGLFMEARISPTSWGKDYHQLISDGLLTNMSFGMQVGKDNWEKRSDGLYERSISDISLAEVSVVRNPAYVQSSIQARSIDVIEPTITITEEPEMEKNKEKALKELRAQLEALEAEVREVPENVEVKEERAVAPVEKAVNKEAVELRGVELFIKGDVNAQEVRDLVTTSAPGSLTVPTTLSKLIIEKLVEQAPLFSRGRGFQTVSGTLEVLREQTIGAATFIGEMENATTADFTFDKIVLEQRRAATAIELSNQLINDSGINVIDYAVNVLTRRLSREIDRNVLVGNKANKQLEGILTSAVVEEFTTAQAGKIGIDDLADLTLNIHPDYLDGAVFVVGRPAFNQIAKLKDAFNNYYLVKDVVNGKFVYRIFGHDVIIQDNMPALATGAIAVAFVNFNQAYATMIKRGVQLKRITDDTTQALRGSQLLMLDVYLDGKILNEDAMKFLKLQ